jgi:hypothetical protein
MIHTPRAAERFAFFAVDYAICQCAGLGFWTFRRLA